MADAAVLSAIARGEAHLLGVLFERYHHHLRRALRRSHVPWGEVDDVVQITFLEVLKIAGSFDGRASCRGWLCGVALRLASRKHRSALRRQRTLRALGEGAHAEMAPDAFEITASRETLREIERALGTLKPKKRHVFVRAVIEGSSMSETASELGVPQATVRTRLFHARAEVFHALDQLREAG